MSRSTVNPDGVGWLNLEAPDCPSAAIVATTAATAATIQCRFHPVCADSLHMLIPPGFVHSQLFLHPTVESTAIDGTTRGRMKNSADFFCRQVLARQAMAHLQVSTPSAIMDRVRCLMYCRQKYFR
jgi:hypothetical protein